MTFPRGLRALNHADFRRFFAAQLLALIGGWMQTVAQSWLVLQLTNSPFRLGLVGTLQFAPVLLFSILTGAVADRLPTRRVLMATQATLGGQALLLAALVWTDRVQYWHVCALALLLGLANVVDLPARQSFIVHLVGKADVVNAVALNSAAFNAARIVGPAVAGVLIARAGVAPAFALNSAGFVVAIATLATLRAEGSPAARAGTTIGEEIAEGLRYARRTPLIRLILALLFVVSLCVFNFTVYVPLLARQVLHLGPEGFGFLMTALGVGAVAGALSVGMLGPRPPPLGAMFASATVALSGLLGLGAVGRVWTAVPLLFLVGFFGLIVVAGCNTGLQLAAPDALRGRVMSLYVLVYGGVFPFGAFMVGTISERWSVSTAFVSAGAFGLLVLAAIVVASRTACRPSHPAPPGSPAAEPPGHS